MENKFSNSKFSIVCLQKEYLKKKGFIKIKHEV